MDEELNRAIQRERCQRPLAKGSGEAVVVGWKAARAPVRCLPLAARWSPSVSVPG